MPHDEESSSSDSDDMDGDFMQAGERLDDDEDLRLHVLGDKSDFTRQLREGSGFKAPSLGQCVPGMLIPLAELR